MKVSIPRDGDPLPITIGGEEWCIDIVRVEATDDSQARITIQTRRENPERDGGFEYKNYSFIPKPQFVFAQEHGNIAVASDGKVDSYFPVSLAREPDQDYNDQGLRLHTQDVDSFGEIARQMLDIIKAAREYQAAQN